MGFMIIMKNVFMSIVLRIVDNDHAFYLLRCDWPSARLLSQKVHHMGRELLTTLGQGESYLTLLLIFEATNLVILFQLLVVDVPDLAELGLVVAVLY